MNVGAGEAAASRQMQQRVGQQGGRAHYESSWVAATETCLIKTGRVSQRCPGNSRDLRVSAGKKERRKQRTQCQNTILLAAPYKLMNFDFSLPPSWNTGSKIGYASAACFPSTWPSPRVENCGLWRQFCFAVQVR